MGTNYYVNTPACDHCGHQPELIHIGKSSFGWKFCFNSQIFSHADYWYTYLQNKEIVDEGCNPIDLTDFWDMAYSKRESKSQTVEYPGYFYTDGIYDYYGKGEFC